MTLDRIDQSYWLVKDKDWMAEREAQWPRVEFMLSSYQLKKKAIKPIQDYFLRGKMPPWNTFLDWPDHDGHLNVFLFLWLHPSWDKCTLQELFRQYMSAESILPRDIVRGYRQFMGSQTVYTTGNYRNMEKLAAPYLEGHTELLYEILYGDMAFVEESIKRLLKHSHQYSGSDWDVSVNEGFGQISFMADWLSLKEIRLPIQADFLLQYTMPLEHWYMSCSKDETFFKEGSRGYMFLEVVTETLVHIHQFDIDEEGDTPRTRFVQKIRKILDEREFISEFKQMWLAVKAGNIAIG